MDTIFSAAPKSSAYISTVDYYFLGIHTNILSTLKATWWLLRLYAGSFTCSDQVQEKVAILEETKERAPECLQLHTAALFQQLSRDAW